MGGFQLKFYLTEEAVRNYRELQPLADKYPDGSPSQPIKPSLADDSLEDFASRLCWDQVVYLDLRHGQEVLYEGYADIWPNAIIFGSRLDEKKHFPKPGLSTYFLSINHHAPTSAYDSQIMLTTGDQHDRYVLARRNCYYDIDLANPPPFPRQYNSKVFPACDDSLDYFAGMGHWGLPRPDRLLLFDPTINKWRADRPGEYPDYYANQLIRYLNKITKRPPKEFVDWSSLNKKALKEKARAFGREYMEEVVAHKQAIAADLSSGWHLSMAFMAYGLVMAGSEPAEIKDFFLTITQERATSPPELEDRYWGGTDASGAFAAILEACHNLNTIEVDMIFD